MVKLGLVPINSQHGIAGRLANHAENWEKITKDRWVLDVIKGYQIEFLRSRYQTRRPHTPHYNIEQNKLLAEEVRDLLQKGAVSQVEEPENGEGFFYSNLFLVPKKDGGQRPVINLKALNQFVQTQHFKMEGIHTLKDILKPGDWLT